MSFPVHQPDDADQFLADFGVDLVVAGASHITRGMLDDDVDDDGGKITQRVVLRLKRGALQGVKVKDLAVTVDPSDKNLSYRIHRELERSSSLFDYYLLRTVVP